MSQAVPISLLDQVYGRIQSKVAPPVTGNAAEYGARNPRSHVIGIGIVVLLHIVFIYGLASGLAHQMVDVIKQPLETRLIQEAAPPPKEVVPPPPVMVPPPPVYIPPPEVQIEQAAPTASDAITVVTTTPPPKAVSAPAPVRSVTRPPSNGGRPACGDADSIYPSASEELSEAGAVVIYALVNASGSIIDTRLVNSSGFPRLDNAALTGAASICRYSSPASVDGHPTQGWTSITFNFHPAGE